MLPSWFDETKEEILQRQLRKIPNEYDKREGGFVYDILAPNAEDREIGRVALKNAFLTMFVKNATGDQLDELIEDRSPLKRTKMKEAYGKVLVEGNTGTFLPAGTLYMSLVNNEENLIEFRQNENATIGQNGEVLVDVTCLTKGTIGNIPANTIEIASPIIGVARVNNPDDFEGGLNREGDDSFKSKYFTWIQEDASSGNVAHYVKWALEVPGIGGVQVEPLAYGRGTVKVIAIDTEGRPASSVLVEELQEKLAEVPEMGLGYAPIGATLTVVPADYINIDIEVSVLLDGSRTLGSIQNDFEQAIEDFLRTENLNNWRSRSKEYIISANRFGAMLIGLDGVQDVIGLFLNENPTSIVIPAGKVGLKGQVTISEY